MDLTFMLGGKKDRRDVRDRLKASVAPPEDLPPKCELPSFPAIRNQGQMNSCVGQASAWMWEQVLASRGLYPGRLSAAFIWRQARVLEGSGDLNDGVEIRTAMKVLNQLGVAPAEYHSEASKLTDDPDKTAIIFAKALAVPAYARCESLHLIRHSIAVEKQAVVVGLPVTRKWFDGYARQTGQIRWNAEAEVVGFHAMVAAGYDDEKGLILLANSWGPEYGRDGFNLVDYAYFQNEIWDGWTVDFEALPNPVS